MVVQQPSKLRMRVRFPLSAPDIPPLQLKKLMHLGGRQPMRYFRPRGKCEIFYMSSAFAFRQ